MHAPLAAAAGRTASPATARLINDRLALRLLQSEGPLTAGQLKKLTGLSRPTVADLVDRLQEAGLVAVVGESGAQRRGPNARLYGIVADRAHLLGLDLRTHSLTVAVADLLGQVRAERTVPVDPPGAADTTAAALAGALATIDGTLAEAGAAAPHALAIGAPGLVDPVTGRLGGSAPAWHDALIDALRDRGTGTLLLENEVNLAALAEQRDGAARDRDTFVLLWLGHGTGAAVVLDGAVRRGASGGAGEIGFLPVPGTGGLPSATGCDGGFHSLAGSAAISRLAAEHGRAPTAADDDGRARTEAPPAEGLVRDAVAEGAGGAAFLDALAARIALGVSGVCAVLDPGCVVLGGEIGRAGGDPLAERVADHLARLSPLRTEVRAGTVGGRAVLRGAVLAARDAAQDDLFGAAR
ncbi:ROK family transcriptional regulator [Streptomyces sp. NPDC059122]|uniref:ROK family transcriptional regulator n=1 Tax=Streptomyces sp. NPDC059122 TaxID=3346732 RepID=UPI0036751A8F